ncbi:MAG TPA: TerC family protein [Steroidobacteraceae bacterium]|nr:TerC family protein [Steroidobacteraceae bacterium]
MLQLLLSPQTWLAFIALTALETVLGLDNIIFISILVAKLPRPSQRVARVWGLALAMGTRIALLFTIVWLTRLTQPWFELGNRVFSGRDVVLLIGGAVLLVKSVLELHHSMEGAAPDRDAPRAYASVISTVLQIALIDIVFSVDSVFTAVGLANDLPIMVAAIIVSILIMLWVSGAIAAFIERHPTIKVMALAFLLLIGVALIAEGFHLDIPKGYLYFAMAFSIGVEMINLRIRRLLDHAGKKDKGRPR